MNKSKAELDAIIEEMKERVGADEMISNLQDYLDSNDLQAFVEYVDNEHDLGLIESDDDDDKGEE